MDIGKTPIRDEASSAKAMFHGQASYVEVEIDGSLVNLFERQGDGKTEVIVKALAAYGLRLRERVSSPCG